MTQVADRLAIIGVGLIGGSVALALRRSGHVGEIIGCGRSESNLKRAVELGVIDRYQLDPAEAVAGADMVLLAVPVGAMQATMRTIAPALVEDSVVTDAGSTKCSVIEAANSTLGDHLARFVPGHPIAGTESQGVDAAFAELFQGRRVILTPTEATAEDAYQRCVALWETVGAVVSEMDAEHHDEVLGATSHLPHVLAFALVDQLAAMQEKREIFEYSAGGFRDFTRIASSSPEMWRDIVHANREALLPVLAGFGRKLEVLAQAIENDDMDTVMACFTRAKRTRDRLIGLANAGKGSGAVDSVTRKPDA